MSALGRLVAAVALETAEFTGGADKAKYTAAQMASEVDRTLKGLETKIKGTMGSIGAAIAGGFAISALKAQFDSYAEGAAKLGDLAAKAGTTTDKMSGLIDVAKLSRTTADDLTSALAKLSRGLVNQTGDTAGAGKALAFLGISANDSTGKLKDSVEITEEVAAKLALMQDGAAKTAIVMDLYGKAGANVIPVLKDLAEFGMKNATITAQQAAIAKEYEQDLVRLGMAKSALVRIIASELLPVADALVKTLLNMQTQTGGVRDQAQALAQDGSIRAFAMSAVNFIGMVMDAGDGVARVFYGIGEQIAYIVARTGAAISTVAQASLAFAGGDLMGSIDAVTKGAAKDAQIVADHGQALRAIFEKPLAGATFVAGVEQNLAAIDAKMKTHGTTVKATADGYRQFRQATMDANDAATSLADSLGKTDAKLRADLLSLTLYGTVQKDSTLATIQWEVEHGKVAKLLADRTKYTKEASDAMKANIIATAQDIDLTKMQIEAYTKYLEAVKQSNDAMASAVQSTVDQVKVEQDKIATFGLSTSQITLYTVAQLEAKKAQLEMTEGAEDQVKALDLQIAKLKELSGLQATYQDVQQQTKVWSDLGTAAGNFFGNLAVNGSKAFTDLKNQLRSFAAEVISFFAKRFLLQMVTGVAGSVGASGVQAAGNSALNGMGNSLMGTAATAANEYGGSLIGASTFTGGVSSAVFGTGALTGAGDFVGTGLAGLAGNMALAAGATDAMAASIAAVVPVIGWIIAAAAILYAIFGSKGGAPKSGGSFMGNFDPSGALTGSTLAPGDANGRFFTPNGADSQMQAATKGVAAAYYGTLASLGGKAPGSVGFGLGFDTDPGGTADNRISSAVSVNGNTVFLSKDRGIGRDQNQIAPEMQLEASRMILSALQSSELPQYIANVFKGVDALTADQTTINNLLQTAGALKTIFDVTQHDPLADLAQGMTDALNPLAAALRNNKAAIEGAMKAWDGSLATTQNLQQATVSYYNAQLQLMAGIEQTKQSIDAMFGNTVRNFKLAGMDSQGKYNYYQQDAASLQQQILASSDPSTIQALSQKLDQDMEAAFNLLTPEQQAGPEGQAFISRAESTDKAIGDHLDAIKKDLVDATKEMLTEIKDAIGASDATQTAAASTNLDAAHITLTAAQTPRQLILTINGEQQVVSFGG